jgi:hypothetical protein
MKRLYSFLRLKAIIWTISLFCLLVAGFATFVCLNTERKRHEAQAALDAQRDAITQQGLVRDDGGFERAKPLPLDYENRLSPMRQEKGSGKTSSAKPPATQ